MTHQEEFAGYMMADKQAEQARDRDPENLDKYFVPYLHVPREVDSDDHQDGSSRGRGEGRRRGRGRGRRG